MLGIVCTELSRHFSLRLEVREQWKADSTRFGERFVAPLTVDRNANQLRAVGGEFLAQLVVERHLISTHGTPIRRVEGHHQRFAAKVGERIRLARYGLESERRSFCT